MRNQCLQKILKSLRNSLKYYEKSRISIPKKIGIRFKENEQLKELIKQIEKQKITYALAYYFNPNWKKNYEKFLSDIVGIK